MMAKKSEFAQRLLDDSRMRKERMAAGEGKSYGQSSNTVATRDVYGQSMKGQRVHPHKTGTSRADAMHRSSSRRSRSFVAESSSNQLVPYSQGHGRKQINDLSEVLDFSSKNRQKLSMDSSMSRSLLAFLQQISHGSVIDFRNSERKGNIKVSTFHINEISKGAQKLNNILAACSKGINVDRYSIEIGKELFRSAKDLEESLRMLITLQEAASNMTTPQRKGRIRLLEGSEEDEDNDNPIILENQKQIDRPRFSFDKVSSSNNAHRNREADNSLRQRSASLEYVTNTRIPNADPGSSSMSHVRSFGQGGEVSSNTAMSENRKGTSLNTLKSEKKILPNIIAKLMGLEEGSQHVKSKNEMHKESELKQKDVSNTSIKQAQESIESNLKNKGAEMSQAQMVKTRFLQADMIPMHKGASFDIHGKKRQNNGNVSQQNAIQGRNKLWKYSENAESKSLALSERAKNPTILEKNATRLSQHQIIQEGKRNFGNEKEVKASTKRVSSNPVTSTHSQTKGKRSNQTDTRILPMKEMGKESKFEMESRNSMRRLAQNGQSKRIIFGQPENINQGYTQDNMEQKMRRNRLHMKDREGREGVIVVSKQARQDVSASKTKNPELNHELQKHQNNDSVSTSFVMRDHDSSDDQSSSIFTNNVATDIKSDHNLFSKDQGVETGLKKTNAPPLKEEKYVQVISSVNKVTKLKVHKMNSLKITDQVMNKNKDMAHSFNRSQEHQCAALEETEFPQDDGNNSKFVAKDNSRSSTEPLQYTKKTPQNQVEKPSAPSVLQIPYPTDIAQHAASEAITHEHEQAPLRRSDNIREPISCYVQPKEAGANKMSPDVSDILNGTTHKTRTTTKPVPLTEEETQVKHILVSTQQFLNTAEALFKLSFPVNILQTGDQEFGDKMNKLILDAGYEIMKRKGRRQALNIHPFTKILLTFPKVVSLDELVKQLCKDFETLQSYGGKWGDDTGAYLLKMVERDMYYEHPDINCMWDYGWNHSSFTLVEKDNTIQELERYILDDLINDILHEI